jgi:GTP-binding protein YchF
MLSAGIVGLPNVGKSTLFNAVTRTRKAQAANYPFCTIDPNLGVVTVPDPRLDTLAKLSHSQKIIPAAIEFVDIAGLVKGASAGEGLGNQFLSHIREVDAIVQVVRCFENSDVHHVSGTIDPLRDIEVINTELILADLASLQKRRHRLQKEIRAGSKSARAESAIIEKMLPHLDSGKPAVTLKLTHEEKITALDFFLLTSKPTLFACNVAESDLAPISQENGASPAFQHIRAVQEYARHHFATEAVVISAQIESELVDLSEAEAQEYLRDLGVTGSGVSAAAVPITPRVFAPTQTAMPMMFGPGMHWQRVTISANSSLLSQRRVSTRMRRAQTSPTPPTPQSAIIRNALKTDIRGTSGSTIR